MKRNPWVAPGVRYHDYLNGKWNGYEIVKYNKRFYYYKRDVPDSPIASITAPVFGKPKWMLHKEDLNR